MLRCRCWAQPLHLALLLAAALAPSAAQVESDSEKEAFLRSAKIVRTRSVSVGITGTRRATLSDGRFKHDASIQTVDISKALHQTPGGVEANFKDCYRYNIAAYRLDRLMGLGLVPVSVEREVGGESAAVTWWVDDVLMMEKERFLKKIDPPDVDAWNLQMYQARIFNEFVYNTDPNLGNILITGGWRLRMIDFTRAFRFWKKLRKESNLEGARIDRRFLSSLRALTPTSLRAKLGSILMKGEIEGLLGRRELILAHFDRLISIEGEEQTVIEMPR